MADHRSILLNLHRPPLLARTAQEGARTYSRRRDLKRLLGPRASLPLNQVLDLLIEWEASLEQARRAAAPDYSLVRHVEVLIVLAAEGERLAARQTTTASPPATKRPRGSLHGAEIVTSAPSAPPDHRKLSGTAAFFSAT